MWVTVWYDDLPYCLRAYLSSDGVWHFMGSDVSKLFQYSNSTHFNRRYTCFKLRDTINRCLWRHIPERVLNASVIDLETLIKKFDKRGALEVMHRIFEGDGENLKVVPSGDQGPSLIQKSCPVIKVINQHHEYFEDFRWTTVEYLQTYRMKILEFYNFKTEGTMAPCKSLTSVDAPQRFSIEFGDGVVVNYQRMEE